MTELGYYYPSPDLGLFVRIKSPHLKGPCLTATLIGLDKRDRLDLLRATDLKEA